MHGWITTREAHKQMSLFVKPSNHETRKQKKYRTDISRRENMAYCPETDTYTCTQGKEICPVYVRHSKSAGGYPIEMTIYECGDCSGCPLKEKCIRAGSSRTPLEERSKRLYVSKYFQQQRERMEEKINADEGIMLRVNRSIQAEVSLRLSRKTWTSGGSCCVERSMWQRNGCC